MADDPAAPRTEVRTFLIADVRGYTRFTQTRGDEAAARLAGRFATVVQAVVEQRDGQLLELRGDEALVVFGSPRQAIRAAVELQARFVEETLADPTLPLGVGIGIDSGEAVPVRGGYRGAALNLAARLCSKALAGQVLASSEVTHLARRIDGIRYVDRGPMQFKGIDQPAQVMRVQPAGSDPAASPAFVDAIQPADLATLARRQREHRQQLVAAFAAVAVLGAGIGVVVDRVTRVRALSDIGSDAVGRVSIDGNRLHAAVKVGGSPGAIAADATSVWVVNSGDDTVSRIGLDAPSAPANTIAVGHAPSGVAVSRGAVWVANAADRTVSRVNPRSRTVVDTVGVGTGPVAVAAGFRRIWVANALDDTVSAIDPASDKVVATIPVGAQPSAITVGFGSVWVADTGSSLVSRIDPRTSAVVAAILVGNAPQSLAADPTGMWVTNTLDDTVSHIDVTRNSVIATVHVGHEPTGIAASGDAVWVANSNDDSISRVDPARDRVVRTIDVGNAPQAATVAADDLWVTARASSRHHRGGTLRIVAERDTAKSFDPGTEFSQFGWNVLAVTNDGLVGYRRTAGPAGAQIVPDLAVRMPSISDQGRTYAFQLRRGIRYSDGTTVRASDFRRSLERTIRLGQEPGFFNAVLGIDRCTQRRCDLSRGIVTDDAAGTVTIHLAEPDPELLYKLALPFADVLPPSVPMREKAFSPLPATGPYVISQADDKRIRLTRNRHFRPWSGLAQPDGYPDVIDITIVKGTFGSSGKRAFAAVARGTYDWTPDFANDVDVRALVRTRAAQVHPLLASGLHFFFLNTKEPPFDDVRVRRAVNFAVDRGTVIDAVGGDLHASAACQVVPPTLFAYRPYCPYTTHPDPTGTWKAPDLEAGRRLVRAAGAEGVRVRVLTRPDHPELGPIMVKAMNAIGLRASVQVFPDRGEATPQLYFEYAGDSRNHVAAGFFGWSVDFPEPSNMFTPLLRCSAAAVRSEQNTNASFFCHHALDAQMDRAAALQSTDPAAAAREWAALDQKVTDLAPWVFLYNDRVFDLVSERVGNYQAHPEFGMLLSQIWVR